MMSILPLRGLVPIVRVQDVARSIEFYHRLGFVIRNKLESEGRLVWAWLDSGKTYLMLNRAGGPMIPGQRDVILYLYSPDLVTYREQLAADGIKVGPIEHPPYMPEGEFGIEDPDGYRVLVGQTDEVAF
jgi:catechol 2,3-dioxygenase-like lactoylglutathione lyase family enzyme